MDVVRQIMVVAALIATVAFNSVSQTLPIGGQTSADVSNRYFTFFTPANYAFAIWGVIYLLLTAYAVYQAFPSQRTDPSQRDTGWLFVATCVLNCAWITLFQYELLWLTVPVIAGLLLSLIAIYLRLGTGARSTTLQQSLLLRLPFSVYLGWVSVATIANVALLGVSAGQTDLAGIPGPVWSAIMLVVASVLGVVMSITRRDLGFAAVLVWAFAAIVNKQAATPVVTTTASAGIAVILLAVIAGIVLSRRRTPAAIAA